MVENVRVRAEDVLPVRSRVSWSAVFGGAVIALALQLILSLLGAALGLSLSHRMTAEHLGTGTAIWAVASALISLFVGGMVTSRLVAGEDHSEAVVHGLLMWGVVLALVLVLAATGASSGFSAMLGVANATDAGQDWQAAARRAGVPAAQLEEWQRRASAAMEEAQRTSTDPDAQRAAVDTAARATGWALFGAVLSMAAAALGAFAGAGPEPQLLMTRIFRSRVVVR
jgi:hypothetical protein